MRGIHDTIKETIIDEFSKSGFATYGSGNWIYIEWLIDGRIIGYIWIFTNSIRYRFVGCNDIDKHVTIDELDIAEIVKMFRDRI